MKKNNKKETKNEIKNEQNLIKLNDVLKEANQYDELETYTLKNGEDIQFYPYFSRTKIKEIIEEFQEYQKSEDKEDKKFMDFITEGELNIVLFWYFLAVKKFTHFGEQMKDAKQVKDLVPYFNALLETGLLEEIINDTFIFSEVKKINNMFAETTALMSSAMEFLNTYEDSLNETRAKFKKNLLHEG